MRSNFIWFSHLLTFGLCAFLFIQNQTIRNELTALRSENQSSVVLQANGDSAEESDPQPKQPDRELVRLRNEVGLLRGRVDSLTQEQLAIRRESISQSPQDDNFQEKQITAQEHEMRIKAVETSLEEGKEELSKAKSNYLELWKTLNVPDEILNMEASTVFKDPRLKQYWPFFEAQKDLENRGRIIDAIGLKLAAEKI